MWILIFGGVYFVFKSVFEFFILVSFGELLHFFLFFFIIILF